jgi:tetratricopeptide (TPR) repeat protein
MPELAEAGRVSEPLELLKNAYAAVSDARDGLQVTPFAIEEIMAGAREIYASACTPANTMLITQVVEHVLHYPAYKNDPEIWAFYANVRCCDYLNRWNGSDAAELAGAERAVATALRLDPKHRRAVYVSGFLHRARGRHAESLAAFERVIALKPEATDRIIAEAYAQSGTQWMYLGHPERTGALVETAIAITPPDSPAVGVFCWIAGRVPFVQGNYEEAIDWLERSVAIRSNFWYSRAWLIASYALTGRTDAARHALIEFQTLFPRLNSVAIVINAERNIPHSHPLLIDARIKVHDGLVLAGLPAGAEMLAHGLC